MSQKPHYQTQMNTLTILPALFSMNQDNDSTSSAIDEREIRESHQHQQVFPTLPNVRNSNHHGAMHIRHSSAYSDTDSIDDHRAFPLKLHACLDDAQSRGFDHIISWQKHSLFKIKDVDAFEEHIMPQYFRSQTKYKSFQRQLNLYEFDRIPKGPFRGSYMHPFFKRGQHELSNRMRLRKIKGRNAVSGSPKTTKPQEVTKQEAIVIPQPKEETKEATVKDNPRLVHPEPHPEPQEPARQTQTVPPPPARRPRNRPSPQCTFEGRKFFPI